MAGHARPPSFVTVTLMTFVSPATQAFGTLSLTQSALQSAALNHMSRTGVLFSVFHHDPADCRSQRTRYEPIAGVVNGTFTVCAPPGGIGAAIEPDAPCACVTTPFFSMR